MKADMTEAITADIVVYILVYFSLGLSMILTLAGVGNEICFALIPINVFVLLVHPIIGFVIHIVLFSVIYTYAIRFIRKRWAAGSFGAGGSGVVSQQHINAMRWTRQNRR